MFLLVDMTHISDATNEFNKVTNSIIFSSKNYVF